jgi:hypothetical protein
MTLALLFFLFSPPIIIIIIIIITFPSNKNKYELFLFLLDENFNNHDNVKPLRRLRENHHVNLSEFRILYQCQLKNVVHFKIGQDDSPINDCNRSSSPSLKPATTYNVTILLTNTVGNKSSYKLYSYQVRTLGVSKDLSLLGLLSLLLIIPIAIVLRKLLAKSVSNQFLIFTKIVCNSLL